MPNLSKKKDERYWGTWRQSGAIGTFDPQISEDQSQRTAAYLAGRGCRKSQAVVRRKYWRDRRKAYKRGLREIRRLAAQGYDNGLLEQCREDLDNKYPELSSPTIMMTM